MSFANRDEAGRQLARRLQHLRGQPVVVLGLPRGGVPVAAQVARALGAPLDVIVVRKVGVPFQPELAMGAVGEDGVAVRDSRVVRPCGASRRRRHDARGVTRPASGQEREGPEAPPTHGRRRARRAHEGFRAPVEVYRPDVGSDE